MLRVAVFVIAILLLAGTVEPAQGWLIALVVLSGLSLVWAGPVNLFRWGARSGRRAERFARRMERRFERQWNWDPDW